MRAFTRVAVIGLTLLLAAMPAMAQGRHPKHYKVTNDHALNVTKEVLVHQGYEVISVENKGSDIIVWYRAGNKGKGKGHGPKVKMVIHREAERVIFVDTPSTILVDIDLKLKL